MLKCAKNHANWFRRFEAMIVQSNAVASAFWATLYINRCLYLTVQSVVDCSDYSVHIERHWKLGNLFIDISYGKFN